MNPSHTLYRRASSRDDDAKRRRKKKQQIHDAPPHRRALVSGQSKDDIQNVRFPHARDLERDARSVRRLAFRRALITPETRRAVASRETFLSPSPRSHLTLASSSSRGRPCARAPRATAAVWRVVDRPESLGRMTERHE